jgi:hypothetical protein
MSDGTRPSDNFEIPRAVRPDGWMDPPERASKNVEYRCPGCLGRVDFYQGKIVAWHFGHAKGNAPGACSKESVEHRTAIRLVVEAAKRGEFSVLVSPSCARCNESDLGKIVEVYIPIDDGDDKNVALGNGKFGDAILYRGSIPIFNAEVMYAHPVPQDKIDIMPIAAIEVLGNPTGPWSIRSDSSGSKRWGFFGDLKNLIPVVKSCSTCERADQEAIERKAVEEWNRIQAEKRSAREAEERALQAELAARAEEMRRAREEEERKNSEIWTQQRKEEMDRWNAYYKQRSEEREARRQCNADIARAIGVLHDRRFDALVDRGLVRFDREKWVGCFLCEAIAKHFHGVEHPYGYLRDMDEDAMIWHLEHCA